MRVIIDTKTGKLRVDGQPEADLYSDSAFELISDLWMKVGWQQNYSYTFTWLGVPVIQLPEDMLRFQEAVFRVKPDLIIETGIAFGGSLVYSASLLSMLGGGRVVGVDIDIRTPNRARIEAHPLADRITLLEGSSTAPDIVDAVRSHIRHGEKVLVVLDSNHSYAHVSAELKAYNAFVTPGSYIVATDGVMRQLTDVPRGNPDWKDDNPARAAEDFAAANSNFQIEQPPWLFNESSLSRNITYWPSAYLKRLA